MAVTVSTHFKKDLGVLYEEFSHGLLVLLQSKELESHVLGT